MAGYDVFQTAEIRADLFSAVWYLEVAGGRYKIADFVGPVAANYSGVVRFCGVCGKIGKWYGLFVMRSALSNEKLARVAFCGIAGSRQLVY